MRYLSNKRSLFFSFAACIVAISSTQAQAVTIRVPADQPTIQSAINIAADGDTVLVAPGTYFENIDFLGKAITVTSESGPQVTIIDGSRNGTVVCFISGENLTSVINGFTIRNGSGSGGLPEGGGATVVKSSNRRLTALSIRDTETSNNTCSCPNGNLSARR